MLLLTAAGTLISLGSYAVGAWIFIYAFRFLHATPEGAGVGLGLGAAAGGLIGTSLGGFIGDAWRRRSPTGRLQLTLIATIVPVPIALYAYTTASLPVFYLCYFFIIMIGTLWLAGITSTMQDLVLPRMRGSAGAMFFMGTTLIGLGNGPYLVGLLSDITGDLRWAIVVTYATAPVVWVCLIVAMRLLPAAEESRIARARAAGEPI